MSKEYEIHADCENTYIGILGVASINIPTKELASGLRDGVESFFDLNPDGSVTITSYIESSLYEDDLLIGKEKIDVADWIITASEGSDDIKNALSAIKIIEKKLLDKLAK